MPCCIIFVYDIIDVMCKEDIMKNYLNESLSAQERAEALVNEMTVEEAASQLRYDAPAVERSAFLL